MTDLNFSGRVAIITGAAKGLGRAYAFWLAARGCAVVVSSRASASGPSNVEDIVREIRASGGRAAGHEGDVQSIADAAAAVETALQNFGPPDIFISNAGVQAFRDFASVSLPEIQALLATNLLGAIVGVKAIWPVMLAQGYGRIVLTGSSAGMWGQMQSADYSASKAAMIGLARSLTIDVPNESDIRINIISPVAYTPMSASSFDPKWAEYASPDHVAPVVGWLCSEKCTSSGGIYHAGAGHVRRVQILEGPIRLLADGDIDAVMNSFAPQPEWTSSFASGAEILPAIAAEH